MTDLVYNIGKNGIQVPTLQEHIDWLTQQFKNIYGEDINLNSDTPDGQLINILAQAETDRDELLLNAYNSLNILLAEGVDLDNLVATHGIKRRGGSYTTIAITLTFSKANVVLQGLDNNYNAIESNAFTVSDNNGNQFYLITSYTSAEEGDVILDFRAKNIGIVEIGLETLTNIITPQVGVIASINKSAPLSVGMDEETDAELKERYLITYGNGGQGSYQNIISDLYNVDGVINVQGENNTLNIESSHGTPPHSVWLIIQGGEPEEIAQAIYSSISAGCGMRGEQSYNIIDIYGNNNVIRWDNPSYEPLYIKFSISKKTASSTIDIDYLKESLINSLNLKMNNTIDINEIYSLLYQIQSDLIYKDVELSNNNTNWVDIISNSNLNYIFTLTKDNITITQS